SHSTGNHTRVNNIFCTENLTNAIIKCNTEDVARPVKTDHYPIITQIDIHTDDAQPGNPNKTHKMASDAWKPQCNFRKADWPELIKMLKANLANIPLPTETDSIQEFDERLKNLNEKIQDAINKHVKLTTPCPYSKRWWTLELADKKKIMQQLGGQSKYHRQNIQHPVHNKYQQQRNRY
ncbi:hypothetical protein L208DRAFT_1034178, partial [Tricholoma matsutake]